jgi:CASPASE and TPR Repeat-associated protein
MTWRWLDRIVLSGLRPLRAFRRRNQSGNGSASSFTRSNAPANQPEMSKGTTAPPSEALLVHVFVAADGAHQTADLAYVQKLWQACGDSLGMTGEVPGIGVEWHGPVAARTRPGVGVYQAILRRENDVFCLSVMMEPDRDAGIGWTDLEQQWLAVLGPPPPGMLSVATIFIGSQTAVFSPQEKLLGAWKSGTTVPHGFAVWEESDPDDSRSERRLVVLGKDDTQLSAWTWISAGRQLPPLAKYLLHAAKMRYQIRVWKAGQGFRQLRQETDAIIHRLLETVSPPRRRNPREAELIEASRELVALQAGELGLIDRSTRLREMCRTVDIAAANVAAYGDVFAEDRELAEWFHDQLDDDATYLEAALRRTEQIGSLIDRIVQRNRQRHRDSVNLGLTGAVGAILMSLAAIQSLQYKVPLSAAVKPAVVGTLGLLALWVSLLVVRVVVPERRWSSVLLHIGFGLLTAAIAWIVVAAIVGPTDWTWVICGTAGVVGTIGALSFTRLRH